jgi:tRNA-guanine family transglycosylase
LSSRLATLHNITFFQDFMRRCREEIKNGTFEAFHRAWFAKGSFPAE